MILSYFNSFFEIFVGLNLGYAAFGYFRKELTNRIFRTNHLSGKLNGLKSRIKTQVSEKRDNIELSQTLSNIRDTVDIESKTLDHQEERGRCFINIMKPISLTLSLLCITSLLIAGFQDMSNYKELYSDYFFRLTCFTSVFCFTLFYCTFSDRIIENEIKLSPLQVIIGFTIFLIISCDFVFTFWFSKKSSQLIAFLLIPIATYLLIIGFKVLKIKKYAHKKSLDLIKDFISLTYKNMFPLIGYIFILLVSYIPVIIYYVDKELIFIKYIIILTTPTFLFLFLALRVFVHRKVFGKKYKKIIERHTHTLDTIVNSLNSENSSQKE